MVIVTNRAQQTDNKNCKVHNCSTARGCKKLLVDHAPMCAIQHHCGEQTQKQRVVGEAQQRLSPAKNVHASLLYFLLVDFSLR